MTSVALIVYVCQAPADTLLIEVGLSLGVATTYKRAPGVIEIILMPQCHVAAHIKSASPPKSAPTHSRYM